MLSDQFSEEIVFVVTTGPFRFQRQVYRQDPSAQSHRPMPRAWGVVRVLREMVRREDV